MINREHFMMGDIMNKQQDNTTSSQQAKQIAMIKWLLIKADKDPEAYKEIFQSLPNVMVTGKNFSSRLHPKIVNALQSAELYSSALANMFIDHHFYNPDHNRILQVLARKGVVLSDPQLTVSVLLKSDPINLSAHLSVIEAIMVLYAKEIATSDRIYAAIEKFKSPQYFPNDSNSNTVIPTKVVGDYDQLLLLWISEAVSALNKRIRQELSNAQNNETDTPGSGRNKEEYFKTTCKDITDLIDGIALCALVSFYCPQSLPWRKILVGKPLNTADCLYNLNLFLNVCQNCFPYQVFHMNPEDMLSHKINYMRPNVIALMADLFNLLEISPARCVLPDGRKEMTPTKTDAEFQEAFSSNEQESRTANSSPKVDRKIRNNFTDTQSNNEFFVVHKGRNIPTLSSINPDNPVRDKQYEPVAAGKPTSWNDTRKNQMSSCGRRSRRNSFSDDSQLTIENFGGSHENINLLGRNPDKEPAVVHVQSQISLDKMVENNDGGRHRSQVAAQENRSSAAITSVLFATSNDSPTVNPYHNNTTEPMAVDTSVSKVGTPVVTTKPSMETSEMLESCKVSSQMLNIRLKLEEKRRQIEMEKRRVELNLKKHRQNLNKAAFLQAVSKIDVDNVNVNGTSNDGGGCEKVNNGDGNENDVNDTNNSDDDDADIDHDSIVTYEDISQVEQRWLKDDGGGGRNLNGDSSQFETQLSPDDIDIEKCQKSISEMDSSLHAIQTDLQWLNIKENEMLRNNPLPEPHNADVPKPYPVSFMLNHDAQQAQQNQLMNRRLLVSNQQNQMNDFYSNSVDYNTNDGRVNYVGNMMNKNFAEFNYNEGYGTPHTNVHHHSLISPLPMKTSMVAANSQMVPVFDNVSCATDNVYVYQHQQQEQRSPLLLHSHTPPNFNHNNYRSMNIQNSRPSDNKENQVHVQQPQNEQFYLHRPSDNSPFQFPSPSVSPMNLNYSTPGNTTFSQRKTWDNREETSAVSPQPTPPPRMYTSRYLSNKEQPMTLTKTFTENKQKSIAPSPKFSDDHNISNDNSAVYSSGLATTKKSFSSMHDYAVSHQPNHDLYNLSETDSAVSPRHTPVGCTSIPSPSADDMAPQCISFIGTSDESNVSDSNESKNQFSDNVNKLNIVNGNRTYRIPSPTNKVHLRSGSNHPFINDNDSSKKGFYVSFSNDDDNETDNSKRFTERIKAPLRMKRITNASTISLAKNDKPKVTSIKTKPEIPKKPETIYNEKENIAERRNDNSISEKIMEKASDDTIIIKSKKNGEITNSSVGLLINADVNSNDPAIVDEMERKKERILLQSLQRRQQQEEMKARKEIESQRRKEQEKQKEDLKAQKKEEEKRRRNSILERHRLKKLVEEAEREGKQIDEKLLNALKSNNMNGDSGRGHYPLPKLRSKKQPANMRPRPKTIHIDVGGNLKDRGVDNSLMGSNLNKKGSSVNLAEHNNNSYGMSRRDYYRGSQDCLLAAADMGNTAGTSASSIYSGSSCDQDSFTYNSRYMTDTDSGLGLVTPPHRTSSPAPNNSSSGPGSLPPSHHSRRLRYDDTASESGGSEYSGLRLYKQPAVKSNRGIIMNAIEYCVFPGEVNRSKKSRLVEEISKSDGTSTKHFLILFRDAGCQYRALYSYFPETEEIIKVSGIGPRFVTEDMFDKFFKYNSGTKCFAQVHTKHLTVTIDAFTIHNNLWQGKKVNLPNKRDMTLVI